MIKINAIKTMALAAALTAAASVSAQNHTQKVKNTFFTEKINKINQLTQDEFVSQLKSSNYSENNTTNVSKSSTRSYGSTDPDFEKAVDYYNTKMTSSDKYAVTRKTYDNLETRLYNMEKAIDKAFQECEAYQDIVIIPRWHYRFYPRFNDQLISFDIDEIRNRTTKDMNSLHELKDKAAKIFEEANGIQKHTEPEKTKYDVDEIAKKHLGMDYSEFAEKYKNELDYCKHFTYADFKLADSSVLDVYYKAKDYATEMITTTTTEAHTVNWDIGEKKVDETLKTSSDMYIISDFEYDGITKKGLNEIESGITFKAFEDALTEKYKELKKNDDEKTAVKTVNAEASTKTVKRLVNGKILIFNPDGSIYDTRGKRIECAEKIEK